MFFVAGIIKFYMECSEFVIMSFSTMYSNKLYYLILIITTKSLKHLYYMPVSISCSKENF